MRVETLRNASDTVANAIEKLKIFERYNLRPGYVHASADGQKLKTLRSTRRSRHSRKYFGQGKGLYANTLLANNVPINVRLDSLNTHESHNLFDLLYNNSTGIVVDGVSTDTHGTNRFNFALLGLSDWAHEPRYANTAKVIDSLFVVRETEEGWTLELREKLDVEAIIEGWDYVRRIIVSLHQKDISQTDLVAKLSRSSPSDHSLKALREYDRLLKAIYILDYINDADLRRYVQTVLNRGEAYHQLQRAFGQVGGSKGFRGKSDLEIDMWYECSRLMANCIIYFNSVILSYVLENHERQGNAQGAESMAHTSPVAWVHIIMGGKYLFDHLQDAPDIQSMVERLLAA
jgi:TnpA family transposase